MRTDVEIAARLAAGGRTVLDVMRGTGSVAPRQTGAARVHLVGTAAGPLGGDVVRIRVAVGAGARLELCSTAATLALPGRSGRACLVQLSGSVATGAMLDITLEPLIVAAEAEVRAQTVLEVAAGGLLTLSEQVVLGRWGEQPGRWHGAVHADLGGRAWLRQSLSLGPGSPAWDDLHAPRVLVSRLQSPAAGDAVLVDATAGSAVRAAFAGGGTLITAVGAELASVRRDAQALVRGD